MYLFQQIDTSIENDSLSFPLYEMIVLFSHFTRSVFKDASGTLDKNSRFSALYRQESSKLSDEDMFKLLADFRKYVFPPYHF